MKREDLIVALGDLGYPLVATDKKKITAKKIMEVLDDLAGSDEPRLIEGFPVILANCAHRGIKLNIRALLSRHGVRNRNQYPVSSVQYRILNCLNDVYGKNLLQKPRSSLVKDYGCSSHLMASPMT